MSERDRALFRLWWTLRLVLHGKAKAESEAEQSERRRIAAYAAHGKHYFRKKQEQRERVPDRTGAGDEKRNLVHAAVDRVLSERPEVKHTGPDIVAELRGYRGRYGPMPYGPAYLEKIITAYLKSLK